MESPSSPAAWAGPIKEQFNHAFPGPGRVRLVRAPGRVNLIGEHTDYNDGFVFPMAVEPEIRIAFRGRDDGRVRLASSEFPGPLVEFSVREPIRRVEDPEDPAWWSNYCRGVAAVLENEGVPLTGMDALIVNTLPKGSGLSSSAALETATGLSLLALAGPTLDPMRLALVCQQAEHQFPRVPCGIMDQMIVGTAKAGHATLYDCRHNTRRAVPVDPGEVRVVIANTMVKHELSGGEYAQRRAQCEAGVAHFRREDPGVRALRDVTAQQIASAAGTLDALILRRCRHIVSENQRTTEAAAALEARHYDRAGELMVRSHASLRDDYEVSCAELNFLADQAMKVQGVYGARMTGGGFGGCVVALARPSAVAPLTAHLKRTYTDYHTKDKPRGVAPDVFDTTPTAGASVVE